VCEGHYTFPFNLQQVLQLRVLSLFAVVFCKTLTGFKRKEFRGRLAIAITANLVNRKTEAEARVEEISGVAFIFNQKFFRDLNAATGIDLENIVYYKDKTHYFVMTAKKQSLLNKKVIIRVNSPVIILLNSTNNHLIVTWLYRITQIRSNCSRRRT
jgi:hypothetical protein